MADAKPKIVLLQTATDEIRAVRVGEVMLPVKAGHVALSAGKVTVHLQLVDVDIDAELIQDAPAV